MKKIYLLFILTFGLNLSYGQILFNEVLYDPSNTALEGDANGDGVYGQDDDSFVEIYNAGASSFDISGYEIWDDTASGGSVQFTFPAGTMIPSQEVIVVFGGGTTTGTFGGATVLNAGSGLNFNNSGEVIGLKDQSGNWSLIFDSDALSGNPNESYTRYPDITGPFIQHNDSTAVLFSPGTKTDGTAFNSGSTPASTQLIINEVLYDPSNNSLDGDANGDGVYNQNDDSFIEIYNSDSTNAFDISGYEIWDDTASGGSVQFTFPAGSSIPAKEVAVVFGGGTLPNTLGSSVIFNASTGLSFTNSGDVIGVKDPSGNWVLFFDSDALSNNPNESYTRYPDVTGSFIQHNDSTSVLFSPGTKTDGTAFNPGTPPPPTTLLVINEVLYDPSNSGLDGDANGDGVYSQNDDSFIEIYNSDSNNAFDISGYEIWDDTASGGTVQYTFPAGSSIPAKEVAVVFGGGTLPNTLGSSVIFNANTGLSFTNSGDVIGVKDPSGNWVLFFDSDARSGDPDESYTRYPDVTGDFIQHSDSTAVLFTPGTKVDGTAFNPVPPAPNTSLIINEVLYDPSNTGLEGDANGDGVYVQDDDSFIEIYNSDSSNAFDISGYEIWDDTATGDIQYRFPAGTTIPPKEVIVVFGGGTPTGYFGSAVVLTADSGLNFNNSGELIGLKDASGNWVLTFDSEPLSGNPNESYTRNPDVYGDFEQHGDNFPILFSPGTKVDGSPFNEASSVNDVHSHGQIQVYPNPVSSQLFINSEQNVETVEVYNLQGQRLILTKNLNSSIDVSELSRGVYILKAHTSKGVINTRFVRN